MKHTLLVLLLFVTIPGVAQDREPDDNRKVRYANHHNFEMNLGGGCSISSTIKDNYYSTATFPVQTSVMPTPYFTGGLVYYITKRISAGVNLNKYTWKVSRKPPYSTTTSSKDEAYTASFVANYDLPVRNSRFYVGGWIGYAKEYESGETGLLTQGEGIEYNAHLGYKLNLTDDRLWFYVECGYTNTKIDHAKNSFGYGYYRKYEIGSTPIIGGLKFRI